MEMNKLEEEDKSTLGRRQPIARGCAAEFDGGSYARILANFDNHLAVLGVRVGKRLRNVLNRRAGHTRANQFIGQRLASKEL